MIHRTLVSSLAVILLTVSSVGCSTDVGDDDQGDPDDTSDSDAVGSSAAALTGAGRAKVALDLAGRHGLVARKCEVDGSVNPFCVHVDFRLFGQARKYNAYVSDLNRKLAGKSDPSSSRPGARGPGWTFLCEQKAAYCYPGVDLYTFHAVSTPK